NQSSEIIYAALSVAYTAELEQLGGIFVSVDGGEYWTQIGLSDYMLFDVTSYLQAADAAPPKSGFAQRGVAFPRSTVMAGTTSGLYQARTSGTGIILGEITAEDTGLAIDGAVVSTASGANCLTSLGYYLLLVPSGVHSVRVQAPGHMQLSAPSVQVMAGQSVEQHISVAQVSDNGSCAATYIFDSPADDRTLDVLRAFRDRVLARTCAGSGLISRYYRLSSDIIRLLQQQPRLKARCIELVGNARGLLKAALAGSRSVSPAAVLTEGQALLEDFSRAGAPELQRNLEKLLPLLRQKMITGILYPPSREEVLQPAASRPQYDILTK
ncbi:carboxypeptidase-like regulatory domain-containing protein, partial [Thermodesulfobacteriota bacterium]